MESKFFYQFFNNSTIAALLAVVIGICVAVRQYKKQKKIDFIEKQKYRIIDSLVSLNAKIVQVNFILKRIFNAYQSMDEDMKKDYKEKLKRWHDFIVNNYGDWIIAITIKRISRSIKY
ncbi:MAG: hypothetical protein ACP5QN_03035 [Minisyncoccia bacterium]